MFISIIRILKILFFILIATCINFFCFITSKLVLYKSIFLSLNALKENLDLLISFSFLLTISFLFYYLIVFIIFVSIKKINIKKIFLLSFYLTLLISSMFLIYQLYSLWIGTKSTSALGFIFIPIILLISLPITNFFIYFLLKLFIKRRE